jgi:type IV pilus assembly protein PilA
MQCPHCGAEAIPGNRFCSQCRKRIVPPSEGQSVAPAYGYAAAPPPLDLRRPGIVTMFVILHWIGGGVLLLTTVGLGLGAFSDLQVSGGMLIAAALAGTLGLVHLATGFGLLQMKAWGRTAAIALAILELLALLPGFVLYYLLRPGVKVLFSGRPEQELSAQDILDVRALGQGSPVVIAIVVASVAVLGVFAVPFMGIVAAIAIPSLLRARIAANEASAIGDLRTVVSAEVVYQSANGGRYGTLECLAHPSKCITGYTGVSFIAAETTGSTKQGYQRKLTLSEDSLHYTVSASPVTPGGTGTRAFCTDETGLICQKPAASRATSDDGTCDTRRCTPI